MSSRFATPRTPSVPNNLAMIGYLTERMESFPRSNAPDPVPADRPPHEPRTGAKASQEAPSGRMVQVFATSSIPNGALLRGLLESEGIPVLLRSRIPHSTLRQDSAEFLRSPASNYRCDRRE